MHEMHFCGPRDGWKLVNENGKSSVLRQPERRPDVVFQRLLSNFLTALRFLLNHLVFIFERLFLQVIETSLTAETMSLVWPSRQSGRWAVNRDFGFVLALLDAQHYFRLKAVA